MSRNSRLDSSFDFDDHSVYTAEDLAIFDQIESKSSKPSSTSTTSSSASTRSTSLFPTASITNSHRPLPPSTASLANTSSSQQTLRSFAQQPLSRSLAAPKSSSTPSTSAPFGSIPQPTFRSQPPPVSSAPSLPSASVRSSTALPFAQSLPSTQRMIRASHEALSTQATSLVPSDSRTHNPFSNAAYPNQFPPHRNSTNTTLPSSFTSSSSSSPGSSSSSSSSSSSTSPIQSQLIGSSTPSQLGTTSTTPIISQPISLFLISETHFATRDAPTLRIRELFAQIPGSAQDRQLKRWSFPLTQYERFLSLVRDQCAVRVNLLPHAVKQVFIDKSFARTLTDQTPDVSRIPTDLYTTLLPYQKEGVQFALSRGGKCLIADEMGLGKTMQSIAVASYYRSEWPLLVICPSSVRLQWGEEVLRWHPELDRETHLQVVMKGSQSPDKLVNIMSYDLISRLESEISQLKFNVVICDESHLLKNSKAKRTQFLMPLLRNTKHILLLTGTPALSRPKELFTQLNILNATLFGNFHDYGIRYCDGKRGKFGWDYSGSSNLCELHSLLSSTIMVRRLKSEVLTQLPKKTRAQVFVAMASSHQQTLSKVMKDVQSKAKMRFSSRTSKKDAMAAGHDHFAMLQELWKDTGTAKLPAVVEWIKDRLANESGSFLIFGYHQNVLNGICVALTQINTKYIRIDGNTPGSTRGELVDFYQTTPSCRVAVLSLTAAGCGITLTKATCVVFAELYWNPGTLRQAEDRAHRIGQESPVEVFYLIARNSIDEALWATVSRKLEVLGSALNGAGESLNAAKVNLENSEMVECFISRLSDTGSSKEDHLLGQLLDTIATYDARKARQEERTRLRLQNQVVEFPGDDPTLSLVESEAQTTLMLNPVSSSSSTTQFISAAHLDASTINDESSRQQQPIPITNFTNPRTETPWLVPLEDESEAPSESQNGFERLSKFTSNPTLGSLTRRSLLD